MEHVPVSHVWWNRRVVSFDVENDGGKYHLRFCAGFVAQHLKAQVLSASFSLWCLLGPFPATIALIRYYITNCFQHCSTWTWFTTLQVVLHIPMRTFFLTLQKRASDPGISYHSQDYNPAPPSTVDGRNIDILHQLVDGLSRYKLIIYNVS